MTIVHNRGRRDRFIAASIKGYVGDSPANCCLGVDILACIKLHNTITKSQVKRTSYENKQGYSQIYSRY